MLALQLLVNGKPVVTAGTSGTVSVVCTISAFGDELRALKPNSGQVVVRLGGLTHEPHTRANTASWLDSLNCSVGDEITLRVLETTEIDLPSVTPLPPGIEHSLVPRQSRFSRLLTFLAGDKRAAS